MDRLDIHIEVPPVIFEDISNENSISESSSKILERVEKARNIQKERYKDLDISFNSKLESSLLQKYCKLSSDAKKLLEKAFGALSLSARAYSKILKISRTIADLSSSENIEVIHMAEAVQYRRLDRKYW